MDYTGSDVVAGITMTDDRLVYFFRKDGKTVSGGFYLSPSVGVSYKLKGGQSLSLAVGYHHQEYNQLASFENTLFLTQYVEEISNHAITANIGCSF